MTFLSPLHFLTLVLASMLTTIVLAAPITSLPDKDNSTVTTHEKSEPIDREKSDTIDIAPAPPGTPNLHEVRSEYYFPYRKSMSPRLGAIYDLKEYADTGSLLYMLGFLVLFHDSNLKYYEAGLDAVTNGSGSIHLSRRWITSRTRFRPYYKAGAGFNVVPKDGLVTFLKYQNIQARAGAGFEQLIAPPMSLRLETEAVLSLNAIQLHLTAGYSWAW